MSNEDKPEVAVFEVPPQEADEVLTLALQRSAPLYNAMFASLDQYMSLPPAQRAAFMGVPATDFWLFCALLRHQLIARGIVDTSPNADGTRPGAFRAVISDERAAELDRLASEADESEEKTRGHGLIMSAPNTIQ